MSMYRGIGGANREIKKQYRGISGVNREIKEQYRGISGTNRKVFTSNNLVFKKGGTYIGAGGYCNLINGGVGISLFTGTTSVASPVNSNFVEFFIESSIPITGTLVMNFGSPQTGYISVAAINSSGTPFFDNGTFGTPNITKTYNITSPFVRIRYATDLTNKYTTVTSATFNGQPITFEL